MKKSRMFVITCLCNTENIIGSSDRNTVRNIANRAICWVFSNKEELSSFSNILKEHTKGYIGNESFDANLLSWRRPIVAAISESISLCIEVRECYKGINTKKSCLYMNWEPI